MNEIKFSIVTVCFNAEKYIEATMDTVKQQNYNNYEYIIIDGMSDDSTLDKIKHYKELFAQCQILSEPDTGIYDAMNKGIDMAQGEYIYFLNSGDLFANENVLKDVNDFLLENHADVIYGDAVYIDAKQVGVTRRYRSICSKRLYFLSGDCICHQAIFASAELLRHHKFDLSYKVCADKEWQLYQITRKSKFSASGIVISKVLQDGFSLSNVELFEKETYTCLKKYCPYTYWVYLIIDKMKKSQFFLQMLRKLGKIIFAKR